MKIFFFLSLLPPPPPLMFSFYYFHYNYYYFYLVSLLMLLMIVFTTCPTSRGVTDEVLLWNTFHCIPHCHEKYHCRWGARNLNFGLLFSHLFTSPLPGHWPNLCNIRQMFRLSPFSIHIRHNSVLNRTVTAHVCFSRPVSISHVHPLPFTHACARAQARTLTHRVKEWVYHYNPSVSHDFA